MRPCNQYFNSSWICVIWQRKFTTLRWITFVLSHHMAKTTPHSKWCPRDDFSHQLRSADQHNRICPTMNMTEEWKMHFWWQRDCICSSNQSQWEKFQISLDECLDFSIIIDCSPHTVTDCAIYMSRSLCHFNKQWGLNWLGSEHSGSSMKSSASAMSSTIVEKQLNVIPELAAWSSVRNAYEKQKITQWYHYQKNKWSSIVKWKSNQSH